MKIYEDKYSSLVLKRIINILKRKRKKQRTIYLFCLVWFSGTSTIVGYLMPNPVFTYILNIYDSQNHFVDTYSYMIQEFYF